MKIQILLITLVLATLMTANASTLINYPAPLGTPVSTYFSVKVGGNSVFTHFLKVMDNNMNRFPNPPESGHDEFSTTEAGMAYWSQSGTYTVEVKWLKGVVSSAKLFPASYGITANISGSTVTFSVPVTSTPKQMVLIINNDEKHTLSLFANPLEVNPPSPGDASIIYYAPGIHDVGKISLASNQTLYIAGGAIVNGYVESIGKSNVKILGRGILNSDNYKGANWMYHNIYMSGCVNVQIDGIISMYSNCWTARFSACNTVSLYNYKVAAAYRNYAGGIFPSGGSNYSINYCFTKTTDEEINPKGAPLNGVLVQNHVAYKDRGQGFIIGNHADGSGELQNITFKNCDIYFRSQDTQQQSAMGVSKRQQSDIHNITFENIRVEGNGANNIIQLEIRQDSAKYGDVNGGIRDVLFKDINVMTNSVPPSLFRGASRTGYDAWVRNVTIDNFLYNGSRKCDVAAANLIIDSLAEEPEFTIGASNISINSFIANWCAVSDAVSYWLDVSTSDTFTSILASYNNLLVSGTSQTVTGLLDNTNYYYRVGAVNSSGSIIGYSSTITVTTLANLKNMISNGAFESTASGNFALISSLGSNTPRSVWGGLDNTGGTTAPIVGVTTGGVTGNCAFVTPGSNTSSTIKGFLYQRLPTPSNINTTKTYKLTMKLKAGLTGVKGNLYIKSRSSGLFAVRADYASDNFAWCKYINGIATSWTEYSQTYLFSNSVSGSVTSTTPPSSPAVAFTEADLNDLVFVFYSTGGTAYIDDVQFVEDTDTTTGIYSLKALDNFIVVKERQVSIKNYTGEPVFVYEVTGRQLFKTSSSEFNLDRSGLYIVKMGNKTQRLIIK